MDITPAVLAAAEAFVRLHLQHHDASHDIYHILRVRTMAVRIAAAEGLGKASRALVELAALLHDVHDWKYGGSPAQCGDAIQSLLADQGVSPDTIHHVQSIIQRVGFKEELPTAGPPPPSAAAAGAPGAQGGQQAQQPHANGSASSSTPKQGAGSCPPLSLEAAAVQDADRLDAIGAIGIARCLTFGGAFKRVLYDPAVPPRVNLTKEQYIAGADKATTINHFYEKLLKLKDLMKTAEGRRLAAARHAFMQQYLDQFHAEWTGAA